MRTLLLVLGLMVGTVKSATIDPTKGFSDPDVKPLEVEWPGVYRGFCEEDKANPYVLNETCTNYQRRELGFREDGVVVWRKTKTK